MTYHGDTFNLCELIKCSHQKARGIESLSGAGDLACYSTQWT